MKSASPTIRFAVLAATTACLIAANCYPSEHDLVGDPLFDLEGPQGMLAGKLPDDPTAMASTTKIWTLHLVTWALQQELVSLSDLVTVDAYAASFEPPNSVMADTNGVSLEPGEVVKLDDLVRGMMYPSGNDAAHAIGNYIANRLCEDQLLASRVGVGCLDGADVSDFVDLMNNVAQAQGFLDTHFTNPAGLDDGSAEAPQHFTTARDLAGMWQHSAEFDPYFLEVTGFVGNWTATTMGPNGLKTYQFSFPYFGGQIPLGWEGGKGGGTSQCNGSKSGCMVASAERMGRRVVISYMQGSPWNQEFMMFDDGFEAIFRPELRAGAISGLASHADMEMDDFGHVVAAQLDNNHGLWITTASPDIDGGLIWAGSLFGGTSEVLPVRKGTITEKGGPVSADVDLVRLGGGYFATARRINEQVDLALWKVDADGTPAFVSIGPALLPGSQVALTPVSDNVFVSARIGTNGELLLDSWRRWVQRTNPTPQILHLSSYSDPSLVVEELALSGNRSRSLFEILNGYPGTPYAMVAMRTDSMPLRHQSFEVDEASGTLSLAGDIWASTAATQLAHRALPVPDSLLGPIESLYATAMRDEGGHLYIRLSHIAADGTLTHAGTSKMTQIASTGAIELRPFGKDGLIVASRDETGELRLSVWEIRSYYDGPTDPGPYRAYLVSETVASDANWGVHGLVSVPTTHAEGDFVTGTRSGSGEVRLQGWRVGDRPY